MKISYDWLRTYVAVDRPPEEVADMLTMSGLEVDNLEVRGSSLEGVVIGHVHRVDRHPNADRLTVCRVDVGRGEPLQVVCGAPNVAEGLRVPVALVGTTVRVPDRADPSRRVPLTIQKSKIRGEASEGMICAEDELGLSDDHSGIMVLPPDAPVGAAFESYMRQLGRVTSDAVLDVAVTPNRPDAVSHIGIARDVAALTRLPLRIPEVAVPNGQGVGSPSVRVEIDAPDACPRYVAMVVRGVRIGESPEWLKQRLVAVGLRPRNNVVDITNFVMYESGQPLHAFDYHQVAGATIRVRFSRSGERFTTLDGRERALPDRTLLICDAERPVAIAGVMGGENSEVTDATTDILLESAYFDPSTIRRTARALGLQTDASYRFERGVDTDGQLWAAARACALIAELAGGTVESAVVDARPKAFAERRITLRPGSVRRALGMDVAPDEVRRLLTAIGFDVEEGEVGALICRVPTFRPDVEREIDVIEEIARLHGFDEVPVPASMHIPANAVPTERPIDLVRTRVRTSLQGAGYQEIYTNSLLSRETASLFLVPDLSFLGGGEVVETLNPISQEMAALRPSLLPGALEVLRYNVNRGVRRLRFYELGHVFRGGADASTVVPGYLEEEALLMIASGLRDEPTWYAGATAVDFFDLKGTLEELVGRLAIRDLEVSPAYECTSLTDYHLLVRVGGTLVGTAGRIAASVAARYDLDEPVYFAELSLDRLARSSGLSTPALYAGISRFPRVERDLAFVVDARQEVGPLLDTVAAAGGDLLKQVRPFDLYSGKGVPEGRKSVAFTLTFGAERTLTDEEVEARVGAVVESMRSAHGADLRR